MHGIYTHIPETNYVPREYSVAAVLLLLFMALTSLVSVLNLLYFYISTFRSMCALLLLLLLLRLEWMDVSLRCSHDDDDDDDVDDDDYAWSDIFSDFLNSR